ncbi:MAG TPA: hypothetical protein DDX92_03980 [Flavobacteriales bacterium]|jgi:tetratricopeptide (TPR) repeat protein|nr:hypothetical protein [Flavobacteriales bacterium]
MRNLRIIAIGIGTILLLIASGCEDALTVEPKGDGLFVGEESINTPEQVQELLVGTYDVTANYFNGRSQNFYELLSDNLAAPISQDDYTEVYNRRTNFFNGSISSYFLDPYIAIQRCNSLLRRVDVISGFEDGEKERIIAEAYFLRAIAHFDIVRLFAQPYGYTVDNSHPGIAVVQSVITEPNPREDVATAYAAIEDDLIFAADNLPEENGNYADKYAAYGFLAKMYFQMGRYDDAANYASLIINSGRYSLDPTTDRFSYVGIDNRSPEAVFTTISTDPSNDNRASGFVDNYRPGDIRLTVSRDFMTEYFNSGLNPQLDMRANWFFVLNEGTENELFALVKFDNDLFNVPVIHITDMKLLRAEALARTNSDLETARQDVNDIILRAGRTDIIGAGAGATQIIERALYERRIEMIGEGNRVNELKRLAAIHNEDIVIRDAPWDCPGMILQFPISERTNNFELNEEGGCN